VIRGRRVVILFRFIACGAAGLSAALTPSPPPKGRTDLVGESEHVCPAAEGAQRGFTRSLIRLPFGRPACSACSLTSRSESSEDWKQFVPKRTFPGILSDGICPRGRAIARIVQRVLALAIYNELDGFAAPPERGVQFARVRNTHGRVARHAGSTRAAGDRDSPPQDEVHTP
jgi:hypothetical protein